MTLRLTFPILLLCFSVLPGHLFAQKDSLSAAGNRPGFIYARFYPAALLMRGIKADLLIRPTPRFGINFKGRWQKMDQFRSRQNIVDPLFSMGCIGFFPRGKVLALSGGLWFYTPAARNRWQFYHGPALYFKSAQLVDAPVITEVYCYENRSKMVDVDRKAYGLQYFAGIELYWHRWLTMELFSGIGFRAIRTDEQSDYDGIPFMYQDAIYRDIPAYWKYQPSLHAGLAIGFGY